jgi:uncharacterized damage-inducible protein DinB
VGDGQVSDPFAIPYLQDVRRRFRGLKDLADRALAQVQDGEFDLQLDPEANSVALLVKHLAGNMRARWRAPFRSDGEEERERDHEFEAEAQDTRAALMERWEDGWCLLFETLDTLDAEDLLRTLEVRGRSYRVMEALNHQLVHYAAHVGQIVLLAKHHRSSDWQSLSIPRGRSAQFKPRVRHARQ